MPDLDAVTEAVQENPTGDTAVARVAAILSDHPAVPVRADRVRSQGRVSFGRGRAWGEGICVMLDAEQLDSIEHNADYVEGWECDVETMQIDDDPETPAWKLTGVEWEDVGAVADAVVDVIEERQGDVSADWRAVIDPGVQLLAHAASERDDDAVQIRRGIRSEGRVRFGAEAGTSAVALWVPDDAMTCLKPPTRSETHIEAAFGAAPRPPRRASKRRETSDPGEL